jgi:hypothetical protein
VRCYGQASWVYDFISCKDASGISPIKERGIARRKPEIWHYISPFYQKTNPMLCGDALVAKTRGHVFSQHLALSDPSMPSQLNQAQQAQVLFNLFTEKTGEHFLRLFWWMPEIQEELPFSSFPEPFLSGESASLPQAMYWRLWGPSRILEEEEISRLEMPPSYFAQQNFVKSLIDIAERANNVHAFAAGVLGHWIYPYTPFLELLCFGTPDPTRLYPSALAINI